MPSIKKYFVRISEQPLNPTEAMDFVDSNSNGASTLFRGVTRDHTQDRKVLFLEYECYETMAITKLEQVCKEIVAQWNVKVAILHRIGKLYVGEVSLVVAIGSPHRKDSFNACQYSVDRIKQIVPIWKKEYFTEGSIWIEDESGFRPF
jgi:molybdopterin synthase catalytic subunit